MPKVSLVLPSLNVAKYIDECIESVMRQTLRDIEIICVDAGSTDGTWHKLQEYASQDDRIILVSSDKKSYGYQVNIGIAMAKGEYIAIIETDDCIRPNMLEDLYFRAKEYELDYVKGSFTAFVRSEDKDSFHSVNKKYIITDKIIEPRKYVKLFSEDNSIWTGIYRREFLISNEIKLNETPGAAFQDIGFLMQVLSKAEKAMYVKDAYYNYRIGRAESSVYNDGIVRYVYQEFDWLLNELRLQKTEALYVRLVESVLYETGDLLKKYDYPEGLSLIKDYYDFFKYELTYALERGYLTSQFIEPEIWTELILYLDDLDRFIFYKKAQGIREKQKCLELEHFSREDEPVVIFGAGVYGKNVFERLEAVGVSVVAFTDNSEDKWDQPMQGKAILEPCICLERYPCARYVIANKKHWYEIMLQLIESGIDNYYIWR